MNVDFEESPLLGERFTTLEIDRSIDRSSSHESIGQFFFSFLSFSLNPEAELSAEPFIVQREQSIEEEGSG